MKIRHDYEQEQKYGKSFLEEKKKMWKKAHKHKRTITVWDLALKLYLWLFLFLLVLFVQYFYYGITVNVKLFGGIDNDALILDNDNDALILGDWNLSEDTSLVFRELEMNEVDIFLMFLSERLVCVDYFSNLTYYFYVSDYDGRILAQLVTYMLSIESVSFYLIGLTLF